MEFFCGLDVAMDETAICVVDDKGAVHQASAVTDPVAIRDELKLFLGRLRRVSHKLPAMSYAGASCRFPASVR
jgi:hypothetical protein